MKFLLMATLIANGNGVTSQAVVIDQRTDCMQAAKVWVGNENVKPLSDGFYSKVKGDGFSSTPTIIAEAHCVPLN